jgi:Holliday junction DNA helicase RuvA
LHGRVIKPGVVETNGIGWAVACPTDLVVGDDVALHITSVGRDGTMAFYGFVDEADQRMFDALCKVTRVGPSMALAVLRHYPAGELAALLGARDAAAIAKAPGVGKKTAELICSMCVVPDGVEASRIEVSLDYEVVATLCELGFDEARAREAVARAQGAGVSDEAQLLREALAELRG